jgi:hypothetical protein
MTAKGGETKSREALKLIRRCPHGSIAAGATVRSRYAEYGRLLDEAGRLVDIADGQLTMAEAKRAAWADLERIQVQLETAEANLAEVLRMDEESAWQAVYDTDEAPDPDSISEALNDALAVVADGESVVAALKVRNPHLVGSFLDRVCEARTRIAELRARVEALI